MTNFAAKERLVSQTLIEQGLSDWNFRWDSARTRGGICKHLEKTITISRIVTALNDDSWFIETMRHEIAHAIVGPGHGHNAVWRRTLINLGGNGSRTHSGAVKREAHKVLWICHKCGQSGTKPRLGKNAFWSACIKCRVHVQWFDLRDGSRVDNHGSSTHPAAVTAIKVARKKVS
jgi:predicted SprT family Zn-dependent metalloprotease